METTRLQGKDWLEAQRVEYAAHKITPHATPEQLMKQFNISPAQYLECVFYMGQRGPVVVVKSFDQKVQVPLLEKHVGDAPLRLGTAAECVQHTGMELKDLHPFMENYMWKVLDERIFENEKVFIRAGNPGELLEVESNSLKYVIGVINGLLAEVCQPN